MKGLEELCNVLALPEVKMIRRADDDMRQHEKKEEGKKEKSSSKKRKAKENHHHATTTNDDFDEDMPLAKKHVKMEKAEDDGYFDVKNVKVEPTLGEIDEREDQVCSLHQITKQFKLALSIGKRCLRKPKSLNHTLGIIKRFHPPLVVVRFPTAYAPL